MQKINKVAVSGQDGTMQTLITDMSQKGRGGDTFRYLATEVGKITYRVVRKRGRIAAFEMRDGPLVRRGVWDEPHIRVEGGFADLDESSERSEYYLSPNKQWLFKQQRIYHQLSIANLYKVGTHDLTLVHFDGLRLDEFLMREYLRSKGTQRYLPVLDIRVINFERWIGQDGLRVNVYLRYYADGRKRRDSKDGCAYFEMDLSRRKVLRMVDVTNMDYDVFPNN